MRTVLLTTGIEHGGAQTQLLLLARGLLARGHDVRIMAILPSNGRDEALRALGVHTAVLYRPGRLAAVGVLRRAVRALREYRPDAIISFVFQADMLGRLAGRLAGVDVIVSSIRNERFGGRWREIAVRLTDGLATVTTTNSAIVAESLVSRGIVPAHRLRVVRNGVALGAGDREPTAAGGRRPEARDVIREELDLRCDRFVWLCVGRLVPQKGHDVLLQAWSQLPADARNRASLLVVGDGPLEEQVRHTARALGGDIRLLGLRDDVARLMAAADALVLPSRHEGLPNVVMEAMASGLPVVASDVGGVSELLSHDTTGWMVPPEDPAALATRLRAVMGLSAEARSAVAQAARRFVGENFDPDRIVQDWEALLSSAVARGVRQPDPAGTQDRSWTS